MNYRQLFSLVAAANLSPEQFAPLMGISGMTLRRWVNMPQDEALPELYQRSALAACYQLIVEDKVDAGAAIVRDILEEADTVSFDAVLKTMGFDPSAPSEDDHAALIGGIAQIGAGERRRRHVLENEEQVWSFRRFGEEWAERISLLMKVLKASDINLQLKLPAFGALFYLLTPVDLIPDTIPVVGYLDDFAVLGIIVAYYLRKLPQLFTKSETS